MRYMVCIAAVLSPFCSPGGSTILFLYYVDVSVCSVSSSSAPNSNGAALPCNPVAEQAQSTHNGVVSADTTIGRLSLKRKRSGEIKIETYVCPCWSSLQECSLCFIFVA